MTQRLPPASNAIIPCGKPPGGRGLSYFARLDRAEPSSLPDSLIGMRQSPRLERARQRAAESAKLIAELKLRIASLRAEGADTTKAAKLLDQLKGTHRMLLEQLALEQARSR